jgi:NAD+ synthase
MSASERKPEKAQKVLFSSTLLALDTAKETERIAGVIRTQVADQLRRKGVVIGLSGGIDSTVVAALCVRALGKDRVFGLLMPETDSSPDSLRYGRLVADSLGIRSEIEDIAPILKAAGCYTRRDEAIRTLIPQFTEEYKSKIVLPSLSDESRYSVFSVVVQPPVGSPIKTRLTPETYRGVVAATNFKQRARKMMEYYYADLLGYANAGTCNRLEHELGFFVKNGDGAADLKPIAHLYKTQVYQLAAYLNTPQEIQSRPPTTDTYSMEQTQEEFYFSIPLDKMDLCLFGRDHDVPAEDVAEAVALPVEQVLRVYSQIDSKRKSARYQGMEPLLISDNK